MLLALTLRQLEMQNSSEMQILCLRKFLDRDPNLHSEKEISDIKIKLRFVRKFEISYSVCTRWGNPRPQVQPCGQLGDLLNNITLIENDLNETIIPGKLTKSDLSQLEVEGECVENQSWEDFWSSGSISAVVDKTKLWRQSAVNFEDDEKSMALTPRKLEFERCKSLQ